MPYYKCSSCSGFFSSEEIPAICPFCKKEVSKVSEKKTWDRMIAKAERFVERFRGT